MTVIYIFSDNHIKQVHQLYKEVWWGKKRTIEDTINCVKGSQVCIGILDNNGMLIGFTRIISDFISNDTFRSNYYIQTCEIYLGE